MTDNTLALISSRMAKLKNRRAYVYEFSDGSYGFKFKNLGKGRREIIETRLRLSNEAAVGMVLAFMDLYGRDDFKRDAAKFARVPFGA